MIEGCGHKTLIVYAWPVNSGETLTLAAWWLGWRKWRGRASASWLGKTWIPCLGHGYTAGGKKTRRKGHWKGEAFRMRWCNLKYKCGSPGEKSNIIPLHILIALLHSKCCIFVTGGAHTCCVNSWILDTFTQHVWTPPLAEVLHYSASNAVARSKYATE